MTVSVKVSRRPQWNARTLTRAIVADPQVAATLVVIAAEVVDEARKILAGAPTQGPVIPRGSKGRKKHADPSKPKEWNSDPNATAAQVSVKDFTKTWPVTSARERGRTTRVALVIADHPLSFSWEYGGYGLPATGFMRGALNRVASKHAFLTRRDP